MIHPMHEKYAKLLVNYCTQVGQGDKVSLNVQSLAMPMARALYREVLQAGGQPILHISYPEMTEDFLELAQDHHYQDASLELSEIRQIDAWIRVGAPHNSRALQEANKEKLNLMAKRLREVQNYRVQHTRWCGTLFPTEAGAQDAGMSLSAYEDFVYGAMFLFADDPVAKWQEIYDFQAKLIERLSKADEVHILAEGTDLKMRLKDRTWVNSDGKRNMPSGEVFSSPIEDSAQGYITFGIPSSVNGVEVENIFLRFDKGEVIEAKAEKGDDFLQAQLASDEGARYLGELGIGTNYHIQRPSKSILYDEKIGGTVHLALGQGYLDTGSNNHSAIHWDMICDLRQGGEIYLDGELFQRHGRFVN
ncbi:MAG: aminopeptidase [Deinococcales bacterium]